MKEISPYTKRKFAVFIA